MQMFLTTNLKRDWSTYCNTYLLSKRKTRANENLNNNFNLHQTSIQIIPVFQSSSCQEENMSYKVIDKLFVAHFHIFPGNDRIWYVSIDSL